MDKIFIIKIIITFFISGLWITASTLLAEKFGSKIGGLITNLPSNILISFLFIAITQNIDYVKNAAVTVPVGMTIDTVFILIFIIFLNYNLIVSIIFSLSSWIILAVFFNIFKLNNIYLNIAMFFIITIILFVIAEKILKIQSIPKKLKNYSILQLFIRGFFAGCIVTVIVIIAKFSNPYFTGIITTFPAVLLSTLIILTINQDNKFAQATGKILILSSSNIIIYSMAVYYTYPCFGIVIGTIISLLSSFIYLLMLLPLLKKII